MQRNSKAQAGCLTLLLAWAVLGTSMQLFGGWRHSGPDEGRGGTFASVGLLGVILFFVTFATTGAIRWVAGRLMRRADEPSRPSNLPQEPP